MTTCPICGKPVDSLRAPAVRVSDGKVVPFCSKEHASAWESKPVKLQPAAKVARADEPAAVKKKLRTPVGGIAMTKDPDAPVIEIVHEPASGVISSAGDARTGPVRAAARAETDGAIQIADTGHLDDFVSYDEPLHKSRALLWITIVVLVIGGAAAVLYSLGYFDQMFGARSRRSTPASAKVTTPPVVEDATAAIAPVATADAAAPITPELALDRARTVLQSQIKSDSPRVQRLAASALARTGDERAREVLAAALKSETSESAKVEIGYALARSGDTRGVEALLAAVALKARDPRLEAGRRLAMLGDKRAIPVLVSSLEYEQFRLGIAEALVGVAEPRALKALEQVRADDKSTADEKARATIALGRAGRTDVAPALREMLADDRQNAFAAVALAGLHDEAARPVLVKQLAIPSLRVQAARSLRRLAPDAGVQELIPPLFAALDSNKDTEQVQIAEALLLLAGPPTWSEHE